MPEDTKFDASQSVKPLQENTQSASKTAPYRPLPIKAFPGYPVVAVLAVLSIGVSVLWWSEGDERIMPFLTDYRTWHGEPWRLISSILPHANLMHLAFNLYWLWYFGPVVEKAFGGSATLGIFLLLAAGSNAAAYAFNEEGVGLSGLLYGLCGMVWILGLSDDRFAGVADSRIAKFFLVCFFVCILLTFSQMLLVGNVAHGAGAILGILLGLTISRRGSERTAWASVLAVLVMAFIFYCSLSTPLPEYLNK
ncbi:rhomboid family intramembrane serine protease [Telmatocola sphagniphila]|uniref:Rhomboid family intramembrane serine protease n=1 Tax=Telmatocola sphagniphila TaxID=1123043 RepID=A0A8E6B773_9BACT|nr:rhomboid family intramembrane serine protease [Telmatocola sphagniphila]QVL32729.1 rhomboid family intramembrane serine protease [Telmatocola sphagniphila]